MADLERFIHSDATKLSNKAYFQSLVTEGKRVGLLTDDNIEQIQIDCLELMSKIIEKEISDHSSSVREEVAQSLLASILYTIGLALKQERDSDNAILALRKKSVKSLFKKGREQIDVILNEIKTQHCKIQALRCNFNNSFYEFAINRQLTSFLTKYNPDWSAHNADFLPEYQVECPCNDLVGVEYVKAYADALCIENWFCRQFSKEEFSTLLLRYEELTSDNQCNIFHYTLRLAIANLLTNHKLYRLKFTENDFIHFKKILNNLSTIEIKKLFFQAFNEYSKVNFIEPVYAHYICRSLNMIANEISTHMNNDSLKNVFFPHKQTNLKSHLFINEDISNSAYCDALETITKEDDISKQIQLIKQYATSPAVFIELLSDLLYTPEEIIKLLTALDDLSLAIMLKFCKTEQELDIYGNSKYQNFYCAIEKMLSGFETSRRNKIEKMAENIDFYNNSNI